MKIIYDEDRAKKFSKKRNCIYVITMIFMFIWFAALFYSFIYIIGQKEVRTATWLLLGVGGIVFIWSKIKLVENPVRPDVMYYTTSQTRIIRAVVIRTKQWGWQKTDVVVLEAEDEEGNIEEIDLCAAKYQQNTTVTEMTMDLEKGIVYIPYGGI